MTNDPWADPEPNDENVQEESPDIAAETQDGEITVTIKQTGAHDSPWIVVRGVNPEQVMNQLRGLYSTGLLEAVAKTAQDFAKTAPAGSGRQAPHRQSSAPPGAEAKTCGHKENGQWVSHGQMIFRTGNGNRGPWKGYFCPLPKDHPNQCRPIFVK